MVPAYYEVAAQVIPALVIALFLGPALIPGSPSREIILPPGVTVSSKTDATVARGIVVFVTILSETVALAVLAGLDHGWLSLTVVFLGLGTLLGLIATVACRSVFGQNSGTLSATEARITDLVALLTMIVAWALLIVPNFPWFRDHL